MVGVADGKGCAGSAIHSLQFTVYSLRFTVYGLQLEKLVGVQGSEFTVGRLVEVRSLKKVRIYLSSNRIYERHDFIHRHTARRVRCSSRVYFFPMDFTISAYLRGSNIRVFLAFR